MLLKLKSDQFKGDNTMVMKKMLSLVISAMLGISGGTGTKATNAKKVDNANNTTISQVDKKSEIKKDESKSSDKVKQVDNTKSETKNTSDEKPKTASITVSNKLKSLFEKATYGMTGAVYTPVAVLESSNSSYLVLCKVQMVVPNATPTYALVSLNEKANGNAEITEIKDSKAEAVFVYAPGGWREVNSLTLDKEAKAAFDTAVKYSKYEKYSPIALLGQQVVSGMNYQILVRTNQSDTKTSKYLILQIYQPLSNTAEITAVYDFKTEK